MFCVSECRCQEEQGREGTILHLGYRLLRHQRQEPIRVEQLSRLSSEFLGAFILVLTVTCNILASSTAGALSIACSLSAMIYAMGDVSGGQFNPAVCCAVFCSEPHSPPQSFFSPRGSLLLPCADYGRCCRSLDGRWNLRHCFADLWAEGALPFDLSVVTGADFHFHPGLCF